MLSSITKFEIAFFVNIFILVINDNACYRLMFCNEFIRAGNNIQECDDDDSCIFKRINDDNT